MTDENESPEVVTPRRHRTRGRPAALSKPVETPAALPASDGTLPRGVSAAAASRRRKSTQIGNFQTRLHARPIPGFMLRWVNDIEGRIENFLGRGWDYVTQGEQGVEQESTDPGNKVSRVVGTKPGGDEMRGYLLKIPEEWYKEDQQNEQSQQRKVDETIRRGLLNAKPGDKRYIPKDGITVKTGDKSQTR